MCIPQGWHLAQNIGIRVVSWAVMFLRGLGFGDVPIVFDSLLTAESRRPSVYRPSMNAKLPGASAMSPNSRPLDLSHSRVAKKLAHLTLLEALPTVPGAGFAPASRHPGSQAPGCFASLGRPSCATAAPLRSARRKAFQMTDTTRERHMSAQSDCVSDHTRIPCGLGPSNTRSVCKPVHPGSGVNGVAVRMMEWI